MKIELLEKREPFYDILFNTLQGFLKTKTGTTHLFRFKKEKKKTLLEFFINPKINIIFSKSTSKQLFGNIQKEFSHSIKENPIKSILRKIYIFLALNSIGRYILSKKRFYVSPHSQFLEDLLILGGNHRIRLIDNKTKSSFVILKKGEPKHWITNEVSFRETYNFTFIPHLITSNPAQGWYQEALISGTPINRIKNTSTQTRLTQKAFVYLNEIQNKTKKTENIDTYLCSTFTSINHIVNQNPLFKPIKNKIEKCATLLLEKIKDNIDTSMIELVLSHGDFQEANILEENNSFWIIDWENVTYRSTYYDPLTFLLKLRNYSNFKNTLTTIKHQAFHNIQDVLKINLSTTKKYLIENGRLAVFLVLFENILFLLEENNNTYFFHVDDNLVSYLDLILMELLDE